MGREAKAKKPTPSPAGTIDATLGEIATAVPALQRLSQARLPVKVSYHLSKLGRLVGAEAKHFHDEREKWIKELGAERALTQAETDAGQQGPITEVTPANIPAFLTRVQELSSLPVSLPMTPISIASLGDIEISAADLTALWPLLDDSEPDCPKASTL